MRVAEHAPFLNPDRADVRRDEKRTRANSAHPSSGARDRVQISAEARTLHARQSAREGTSRAATLREVQERVESGLAESSGVLREVADRILEQFGF